VVKALITVESFDPSTQRLRSGHDAQSALATAIYQSPRRLL